MSLNPIKQLGSIIGGLSTGQSELASQISPDDANDSLLIQNNEVFTMSGIVTITYKTIATNSFILDHPVYGILDSSILRLDGGYSSSTLQSTILL